MGGANAHTRTIIEAKNTEQNLKLAIRWKTRIERTRCVLDKDSAGESWFMLEGTKNFHWSYMMKFWTYKIRESNCRSMFMRDKLLRTPAVKEAAIVNLDLSKNAVTHREHILKNFNLVHWFEGFGNLKEFGKVALYQQLFLSWLLSNQLSLKLLFNNNWTCK